MMVAVFALAGCQSASNDPTSEPTDAESVAPSSAPASTAPSEDAGTGEETSVFDLEAGDCFSADGDQLETVTVVDCAQSHVYEAFHVFEHEAGADEPYPGDEEILTYADTECQPPFEEFVGHDYESSIWYITSVTPSSETWAEGDREIICTLNQQDESDEPIEVTGSAEGTEE